MVAGVESLTVKLLLPHQHPVDDVEDLPRGSDGRLVLPWASSPGNGLVPERIQPAEEDRGVRLQVKETVRASQHSHRDNQAKRGLDHGPGLEYPHSCWRTS